MRRGCGVRSAGCGVRGAALLARRRLSGPRIARRADRGSRAVLVGAPGTEGESRSPRRNDGAPPPPRHSAAALRPGALPTAGSTNQARRMFRVKHLFLFPFDAYLPGTWQRASRCRADRLFGFWAQNGTHANVARGELGSQQLGGSRDLGICRASFRKPGAPGPKRRSELAWVPFCAHIACGPPDGPGCFT